MTNQGWLAEQFEQSRPHLEAVSYGMLGSLSEAQDAVQEAWLRLGRSDTGAIDDLRAWLTTVVARISLDMLRSRKARREYAVGSWLPEPLVGEPDDRGPEEQAVLADSIGLALLVVLESLTPPSASLSCSTTSSRCRSTTSPRSWTGARTRPGSPLAHPPLAGAGPVARRVLSTAPRFVNLARPVLVNGEAGALFGTHDDPIAVIGFTVVGGRIAELNLVADPAKLRHLTIEP